jgi:hypothetical protein
VRNLLTLSTVSEQLAYSALRWITIQEWDTTPHVYLDLEHWLLTLLKT